MKTDPAFEIGADIFVPDPKQFQPDATCIVGPIVAREFLNGVWRYEITDEGFPGGGKRRWFREDQIRHRRGTPISQLSGRPGHQGYDEFVRIANSWGYP